MRERAQVLFTDNYHAAERLGYRNLPDTFVFVVTPSVMQCLVAADEVEMRCIQMDREDKRNYTLVYVKTVTPTPDGVLEAAIQTTHAPGQLARGGRIVPKLDRELDEVAEDKM